METESRKKALSHFKNLLFISFSDGKLDEREQKLMFVYGNKMGLTEAELMQIFEHPEEIDIYVPASLHDKLDLLFDLVVIMAVDGDIVDEEMQACCLIAKQMGLNEEVIPLFLEKWTDNLNSGGNRTNVISQMEEELAYSIKNINHEALFEKIMFISTDHIRYQNGIDVSGHNYNCRRGVKIESNINGGIGYTVTMYNMDGNHPVWGNNVQMAPKQMKIESYTDSKIELKGFGKDKLGASFSDYGMTICLDNENKVIKAILHMFDRGVDIEYLR
jgi:hypothetical protein